MVRTILIVGLLGSASIMLAAAWTHSRDPWRDPAKWECFTLPVEGWFITVDRRICVLRPWIDDTNRRF